MKVGIITFHASHNYGSMLQAYALQQTVLSLGHECEIINLRTAIQKSLYKPFFKLPGWRRKIKALAYPKLAYADYRKHRLFEDFLQKNLILTDNEYHSATELAAANLDFDAYISGSDQIWNTGCWDFDTAYFLDFCTKGKKIAYATSMGPSPLSDVTNLLYGVIQRAIKDYDAVSVREAGSAKMIKNITGNNVVITADPTLLISKQQWDSLAGELPIVGGEYILLYTPWQDKHKALYEIAAKTAEEKQIKVICTIPDGYRLWYKRNNFKYFTAVGPIEFLNLLKYSQAVLCGSFHAVVFSLIFGKPFYAYKGIADSRISHLLKLIGLEKCADSIDSMECIDFSQTYEKLKPFIESSRRFLKDSLI